MTSFTKTIVTVSLILLMTGMNESAISQNITQKLRSQKQTEHFAIALEKARILQRLNDGPYTILVPDAQSFNALSEKLKSDNSFLLNHVFTGMATERSLKLMSEITCLSGRTIKVKEGKNGQIMINSMPIIYSNIKADNGIVHIIKGSIK